METTVTVTTKKDTTQLTTWRIVQDRPFPHIERGMYWDMRREPLKQEYTAYLLRSDLTTAEGNRRDFAGYIDSRTNTTNPGAIVLRGKSLGEMTLTITFHQNAEKGYYTRAHAHGGRYWPNEQPTATERAFIDEQLAAPLAAFILANKDALRAEALHSIRVSFDDALTTARNALDKLSADVDGYMAAL